MAAHLLPINATAQNLVWARQMGGTSDDYGNDIAVDGSGNVYTTGYFSGTVDFDPGMGVTSLTSAGNNDIFVSKLIGNSAPSLTGFAATSSTVCVGSVATFTATVGNVTGAYDFTLTNGSSPLSGTTTSTAFSQTFTASGSGAQTFTLIVSDNGFLTSATTTQTVTAPAIPLPLRLIVDREASGKPCSM